MRAKTAESGSGTSRPFEISIVVALGVAGAVTRLLFLSDGSDQQDVVIYRLGIEHFRCVHPPGAPVVILLGRALYLLLGDSLRALQVLNVASSAVLVSSAYLFARPAWGRGLGILTALLILTNPVAWLYGVIGMTDIFQAAGVALVVLFAARSMRGGAPGWAIATIISFGLLLGVKPSHVLILPVVLYALVVTRPTPRSWARWGLAGLLSISVWLIPYLTFLTSPTFLDWTRRHTGLALSAWNVFLPDARFTLPYGPQEKVLLFLRELLPSGAAASLPGLLHSARVPLLAATLLAVALLLAWLARYLFGRRKGKTGSAAVDVLLLWLIPYAVFHLIFLGPTYRFLLPIAIPLTVASIHGVLALGRTLRSRGEEIALAVPAILLSLLFAGSLGKSLAAVRPVHEVLDVRSACAALLGEVSRPGDHLILNEADSRGIPLVPYLDLLDLTPDHVVRDLYPDLPSQEARLTFESRGYDADHLHPLEWVTDRSGTTFICDLAGRLERSVIFLGRPPRGRPALLERMGEFKRMDAFICDPYGDPGISLWRVVPSEGRPLWPEVFHGTGPRDWRRVRLEAGLIEDGTVRPYLFLPGLPDGNWWELALPPSPATRILKLEFGFLAGREAGAGVGFSARLDGKEILFQRKTRTGSLGSFRYSLPGSVAGHRLLLASTSAEGAGREPAFWIPSLVE